MGGREGRNVGWVGEMRDGGKEWRVVGVVRRKAEREEKTIHAVLTCIPQPQGYQVKYW